MKQRLRILHYTGVYAPAWSYGGPPRSVSSLCEGLADLGHEVTVFTTDAGLQNRADIPTNRTVNRAGVKVNYFPAIFGRMGVGSPALEAAVTAQAERFDVIHVTGVWQPTSRAACRAATRASVPYVCSPRGALGGYSFTQKPWKKWPYFYLWEKPNLNGAAAVHFTSEMEAEECRRLRLRSPGFVVPNSIDLGSWRGDRTAAQRWREEAGVAADDFVLLYAGRLHHKKGLELLMEACVGLPREKAWKLILVGYDEDGAGEALRLKFASAGLADRLKILPGVEAAELAKIYAAADVFVFPSRHENFGNVVIEALACGCRVIMSDQVGAADQLLGIEAVAVLPRAAVCWTEKIAAWMDSNVMPLADARAAVEARFSPAAVATRMAEAYFKLTQK